MSTSAMTSNCVTLTSRSGKVFVYVGGGVAARAQTDQGLAAFDVAGGEDAGDVGHLVCINCNQAYLAQRDAELRDEAFFFKSENPIASSISCAGHTRFVPEISPNAESTSTVSTASTVSSPTKRRVSNE